MRYKMAAGALMALAFLIPAAPAMAQAAEPGLDKNCQTVERKVFRDMRELITIDLDTATDTEVEVVATQILTAARAESLPVLPDAMEERLRGTAEELREFLKSGWLNAWRTDLRISVGRTLVDAGENVQAAAQKTLDEEAIEAYLAYLNEGLYAARELDCASEPTPTPTVTPTATSSATPTVAPSPTSTSGAGTPGGEGGGLPNTGAQTATVAAIGTVLVLLGGAGYLIARRRRSRFVA